MKKKSLATMLVALGLTVIIGVGATLAYLSDTTSTLTNTFTVGNVQITLDEDDASTEITTDRTSEGNDYQVYPGQLNVKKDPTVHVAANSELSHIFIKVDGAVRSGNKLTNQSITTDDVNSSWVYYKNEGNSIIYVYTTTVENTTEAVMDLNPLFTKFNVGSTVTGGAQITDITVKAAAIQAAGLTRDQAYAEVNWA